MRKYQNNCSLKTGCVRLECNVLHVSFLACLNNLVRKTTEHSENLFVPRQVPRFFQWKVISVFPSFSLLHFFRQLIYLSLYSSFVYFSVRLPLLFLVETQFALRVTSGKSMAGHSHTLKWFKKTRFTETVKVYGLWN